MPSGSSCTSSDGLDALAEVEAEWTAHLGERYDRTVSGPAPRR
ncbi:hypothetical protein BTZ20_2445 [Rhodococcus sp. MTM3W5.2]|nr:hypothetical protein BTZ20_2445 [Rhodococcus sp. MTM3W5.2]